MSKHDIVFAKVKDIFKKVLCDDSLELGLDSTPDTVEKWDSVNNMVLISEIEEEFGLTFDIDAIFEIRSINDICKYVESNAKSL